MSFTNEGVELLFGWLTNIATGNVENLAFTRGGPHFRRHHPALDHLFRGLHLRALPAGHPAGSLSTDSPGCFPKR